MLIYLNYNQDTNANLGAQKTNLGNSFNYNLAISHSLVKQDDHDHLHKHHHEHEHVHQEAQTFSNVVLGVLEINGIHEDKIHIDGVPDNNSGGDIIYLSPGIKYINKWVSPYFSFGVPLYQHLNGDHPKLSYRALAGFFIFFS